MITNLISGPRNISTALMYSFAQRTDTKVVDEPFYAYYLVSTGIDHPGKEETIQSMPAEPAAILMDVQRLSTMHNHLFLKNMAHHHSGLDWTYLLDFRNVFLIRDPKQLIASFAQVIPNPTLKDIGLKEEAELFDYVSRHGSHRPIVLDAADVLANPEDALGELCNQLAIPFDPSMLQWDEGPIKEDGTWAKYWYHNVHRSAGFTKQTTSSRPLPSQCEALYSEALPYYEKLKTYT